jgi:hypothetical protein
MGWRSQIRRDPRPEFPKAIPLPGSVQAGDLLASLQASDPDASIVDAGALGLYARVHNKAAETIARLCAEKRTFPLL